MAPASADVTGLLQRWSAGDESARDRLNWPRTLWAPRSSHVGSQCPRGVEPRTSRLSGDRGGDRRYESTRDAGQCRSQSTAESTAEVHAGRPDPCSDWTGSTHSDCAIELNQLGHRLRSQPIGANVVDRLSADNAKEEGEVALDRGCCPASITAIPPFFLSAPLFDARYASRSKPIPRAR
jgi:hypothetical protein